MDASIGAVTTPTPQPPPLRQAEPARVPPAAGASATADRSQSSGGEPSSKMLSRLTAERSVDFDDATGSLVYRLVDLGSGILTIQTPSEARLKLRAYIDGVMASSAPEPAIEVTA